MNQKKQELEVQIVELETALAELKSQLHNIELQEQHEAIDHLDDHLKMLDHKWDNLRSFWPMVMEELNQLFNSRTGGR